MAQEPLTIEYTYDAAGNCTMRKVIVLDASAALSSVADSLKAAKHGIADSAYYADHLADVALRLYPNPTQGIIHIETDGEPPKDGYRLVVYSSVGARLIERHFAAAPIVADLSPYPDGYYIVELTIGDRRTTWKVIKR